MFGGVFFFAATFFDTAFFFGFAFFFFVVFFFGFGFGASAFGCGVVVGVVAVVPPVTVTVAEAVLLNVDGSRSVALTDAKLTVVPPAVAVTTIVTVADAFRASVPRLHVTSVVPKQDPCVVRADTNRTADGS